MERELITKQQAKERGLNRYYTGKPCVRGHFSERNISGSCLACREEDKAKRDPDYYKKWRLRNQEKCKAYHAKAREAGYNKDYYRRNREREIAETMRWRANNMDRFKETRKKHYEENKEGLRKVALDYYYDNRERCRERSRNWYQRTIEERREKSRDWRRRNPEKVIEVANNNRAKRSRAPGRITATETKEIFKLQGGKCALCKVKLVKGNKHLDHIIPLSKGGTNERRNAQFLCAPCNLRKNAKDPIDFARENGLLI